MARTGSRSPSVRMQFDWSTRCMVPKSGMQKTNQMNGLYPIVRRVRRPLLPVEVPTQGDSVSGQQADAKPIASVPEKAEAAAASVEKLSEEAGDSKPTTE